MINTDELLAIASRRIKEIKGNKDTTNDILVDELLYQLGYDRRRDTLVKKIYRDDIDWCIENGASKEIAIRSIGYGDSLSNEEELKIIERAEKDNYRVLVITDGIRTKIFVFNYPKRKFNLGAIVNIEKGINTGVLELLSKERFESDKIEQQIESLNKNTRELIYEKIDEVSSIIANKIGESNIENVKEALMSLSSNNESTNIDTEENQKLTEENQKLTEENQKQQGLDKNAEDSYISKIQLLSEELAHAKNKIAELQGTIDEQKNELENTYDKREEKSLDILDNFEVNSATPKTYLYVINSTVYSETSIFKFIGNALSELYRLKTFQANPFIFNASYFRLSNNPVRNDIIIGNKTFDIDMDNIDDNEAISKLKSIYSNFNDIVFVAKVVKNDSIAEESKKVTLEKNVEQTEDNIINENISKGIEEESYEFEEPQEPSQEESYEFEEPQDTPQTQAENSYEFEEQSESNDKSEDIISGDDNDIMRMIEVDAIDSLYEESDNEDNQVFVVGQMEQIDYLIWYDQEDNCKLEFKEIKYIGTNDVTYHISVNNKSYNEVLAKSIDAIIAIEINRGHKDILNRLKNSEMSSISSCIQIISSDTINNPKITGTKYIIKGVESIQQAVEIAHNICDSLNIATSDIFVYFNVVTDSQFIMDNYSFDESDVVIEDNVNYFSNREEHINSNVLLKGDMLSNIPITKNSLIAHQAIFRGISAIKTKYLQTVINSDRDIKNVIIQMVENYYAIKNSVPDFTKLGNIIGEQFAFISSDIGSVSINSWEFNMDSQEFYVSELEEYNVAIMLIKLHTFLFKDGAIVIKANINENAMSFYRESFLSSEPSLNISVRSLVEYIDKNTNK